MSEAPRWQHTLANCGEGFDEFWQAYAKELPGPLLFILGVGFDPRMCHGLQRLLKAAPKMKLKCLAIEMEYLAGGTGLDDRVAANLQQLRQLVAPEDLTLVKVKLASDGHPGKGSSETQGLVRDAIAKMEPVHIAVDLSATPRSVGLTALLAAIQHSDSKPANGVVNVHAIVEHDARLDRQIQQRSIQRDPFVLRGLLAGFEDQPLKEPKTVWMPILGPGRREEIEAMKSKWPPTEVCPVIPSPSENPRLADELIVEYREIVRDERGTVPRNILRVAEHDPMEAYLQIVSTIEEYVESYDRVGGCRVLVTAHSSKLLSLAGLLAVYDARTRKLGHGASLGVVEARAYQFDEPTGTEGDLYSVWLCSNAP